MHFLRPRASFPVLLMLAAVAALLTAGCDSDSNDGDDLGRNPTFSFASGEQTTVLEDSTDGEDPAEYELAVTVEDPGFQELTVDVVFDEDASEVDFSEVTGIERTTTLTFSENATSGTSQTFTFGIEDDDEIGEMAEDVVFTLANPSPGAIGENGSATFVIMDDDLVAIDIAEARERPLGEEVAIEGVVTRLEGSNVRVQDETAGIVVRSEALASAITDGGDASIGDRIRAMGTLDAFNGLRQLGGDEVEYVVLNEDVSLPALQDVALDEIVEDGEEYESELVRVEGLTVQSNEDTFAPDGGDGFGGYTIVGPDGTESLLVVTDDSYYVGEPIPSGTFTFTGVVGQRNGEGAGAEEPDTGYRLLALREGDLSGITAAPLADFVFTPAAPDVGTEVSFDAGASEDPDGQIVSYEWDFGDGDSGSGQTTSHVYDDEGDYDVTLTVTDDDGLTSAVTQTLTVGEGDDGGDAVVLLFEDFQTDDGEGELGQFTEFSVASNENWGPSSAGNPPTAPYALVSGFNADEPSNDWLISPALDLAEAEEEELSFLNEKGFSDEDLDGRGLQVLVSTDYPGEGNPEDFEWTDISDRANFDQSDGSNSEGTGFDEFDASGVIDLTDAAFQSNATYIAFKYTSSGTESGQAYNWEVDNVLVQEAGAGDGDDGFPDPPDRP